MKAQVVVNKHFQVGEIDKRIYGSFIEHLGRAVYGGIYEPTHKTADENGFRQDVIDLIQEIDVPIVRYPGGNFVSGYYWEDGTGDKSKRPHRQELAWESIETNEVGIDEFQQWAKKANTQINMAVNLGTRGPIDAQNLVEYCNSERDTYYANLRRQNGFDQPFKIKTWCLGNEMDGFWQIGSKTSQEYGRIACEAAKLMKWTDPDIELVVCGSSGYGMPTFGQWELDVLDHTYEHVDYISLHEYYNNKKENYGDFLGRSVHMDGFIKSVAAICDAIQAKKHSPKKVHLAFDEWNVWYRTANMAGGWQIAPPLNEDTYNFEDALLVGCLLMTLQNNCDRVKIACLAQLVNVIAPIMTENGGNAWVQTTFYPYLYASRYGRGTTLKHITQCGSYTTTDNLTVPYLETSVIHDADKRELIVFAVNRSLDEDMELSLTLEGFATACMKEHVELYAENLKLTNTKDAQNVKPTPVAVTNTVSAEQIIQLKKHSWNMIRFAY